MNLKHFTIGLALLTLISCGRSAKEASEESDETTSEQPEMAAESEDQPGVYFENLKDGDNVKSPVIIQMGVKGMGIEPAGKVTEGMGHHHIIVDGSFVEKDQIVPMDATHLHFGKGQTVDTLALSPGRHTLTLQFANGLHASYGEEWSKTIGINVEE